VRPPILPGARLGVLGSGQLGRMFAIAARRMGYRVHVFSPDRDSPTGQIADLEVTAPYDDLDAVRDFARGVDAMTFEFENVPAATAAAAAEHTIVRPSGHVLHVTQQRAREKTFAAGLGLPVTPFALVDDESALEDALTRVGTPAVLKSARFGYDGKGQAKVDRPSEAHDAWAALGGQPCVLEQFVDFGLEVSVVAARGVDGAFADYGVVENRHARHILDVTIAPARVSDRVRRDAVDLARAVLEGLDVVGVLCVELFLTRDDRLLINELAPRPHNSGHYTFDACVTSQFEQQVRAMCGLPLGSTRQLTPAVMANLLGDLWEGGEPNWAALCAYPDVKLHLYGKAEARPGRKMGHLTALAATTDAALRLALEARNALTAGSAATAATALVSEAEPARPAPPVPR
jgi:5-(carboxyamino)imidazole ribonucleotide synthase